MTSVRDPQVAGGEHQPAGPVRGHARPAAPGAEPRLAQALDRRPHPRRRRVRDSSPSAAQSRARSTCAPSRPVPDRLRPGAYRLDVAGRAARSRPRTASGPRAVRGARATAVGQLGPAVRPVRDLDRPARGPAGGDRGPGPPPTGSSGVPARPARRARPVRRVGSTATATSPPTRSPSARSRYGPSSGATHGPRPSFLRTARSRRPSHRSTTVAVGGAQRDVVDVGVAVAAALLGAVAQLAPPGQRGRRRVEPLDPGRQQRRVGDADLVAVHQRVPHAGVAEQQGAGQVAGEPARRRSRGDVGVDVPGGRPGGSGAAAGTVRPGTGSSPYRSAAGSSGTAGSPAGTCVGRTAGGRVAGEAQPRPEVVGARSRSPRCG